MSGNVSGWQGQWPRQPTSPHLFFTEEDWRREIQICWISWSWQATPMNVRLCHIISTTIRNWQKPGSHVTCMNTWLREQTMSKLSRRIGSPSRCGIFDHEWWDRFPGLARGHPYSDRLYRCPYSSVQPASWHYAIQFMESVLLPGHAERPGSCLVSRSIQLGRSNRLLKVRQQPIDGTSPISSRIEKWRYVWSREPSKLGIKVQSIGISVAFQRKLCRLSKSVLFVTLGIFLTVDSIRFGYREADARNGWVGNRRR